MPMDTYPHQEVEKKWQQRWADENVFRATNGKGGTYILDMFPYPSGDGLHVGHPEGYTATDIYSRYLRMNGKSVLHPMGWDAFGLPAENYAIKMGVHPADVTAKNVANFKRQIQSLGFSYDWEREVNTTDPAYYKWTQWIFLQLYKRGLAYEKEAPIWWCPKDKTGLANEEVVNGACDRCGTAVEKKMLKQWMLKITAYADRLLDGLNDVEWPEGIKTLQRNWIGKSEGAEVNFSLAPAGNVVMLHGFTGKPENNFFPWVKKQLSALQVEVDVPALPKTDNPNIPEQIQFVEEHCHFTEQTTLLGLSLGTVVALKVVEKQKKPIQHLILTAGFASPRFKDHQRPFEDSFNWKFDWKKIKSNTQCITLLHDINDPAISDQQIAELEEKLGVTAIRVAAKSPHFDADQEPDVLSTLLKSVTVFTTRPDTLYGATYLVLSPEHDLVKQITTEKQKKAVEKYVKSVAAKSDLERTSLEKEKTGVFTGAYVINPVNNEKIPVWIADYVLSSYGTGAIMAVPAHDERDFAFAKKFELPVIEVVHTDEQHDGCWSDEGEMKNSGVYDGMNSADAREKIVDALQGNGLAQSKTQYKLRDWVFSRQRYWGEPIPLVHCETCGVVPVPEDQLPVELPQVEKYEPTGTGESPLAGISEWVNTACPKCGGAAKRETNTMPQWAGSCWYYLRYCDPKNEKELASAEALKSWLPVDMYVGGAEHAVLHLLYARFWHKVLFDAGFIPKEVGDEPFKKLKNQGLILGPDGEKMSKSRGNVINPDEIVEKFGADTLRMYEMFMGPFEDAKPWDTNGILGVRRFLDKVWRAFERRQDIPADDRWHGYAHAITVGIEHFRFNTCVSDLMKWANAWGNEKISQDEFTVFLTLLSPFAPHLSEELWSRSGNTTLLATGSWPVFDPNKVRSATATIAIQVMGKLRGTLTMPTGATQAEVEAAAKAEPNVAKYLTSEPKKIIYVKDKLLNFVV